LLRYIVAFPLALKVSPTHLLWFCLYEFHPMHLLSVCLNGFFCPVLRRLD
jgi:hypothetical protein